MHHAPADIRTSRLPPCTSMMQKPHLTIDGHVHVHSLVLARLGIETNVRCARARARSEKSPFRPCAFFSMFLVTFFFTKPTRARGKKQNVQRKKNALAQCSRPPDRQVTRLAHCVEHSHSFFFLNFFYIQAMIKLNSFPPPPPPPDPVATVRKFDFFPVHDLSSRAKNILDSFQPINIANAFVFLRSLAKCEALACFRFQIKHTS